MVQRKVPSKLGIQEEHVKSDRRLANMKLSLSQHQDGKSRGADMKKKMKKSRSIKLSDLEALQSTPSSSPPSTRSLSQPGKPPPLHVPATAASATTSTSPQKQQPLFRTVDGSPNYMKPTSSSHAKKELFPVSHRNTQPGSDFKNLPRKFSSDSKSACVKKPTKALTRSSSLSLVRTLTKTTSFKASRACSRKSPRAVMCADMSAPHRATCSSTLKDSKFPSFLMLNPGGTESEGTSTMKVCPYTYCSLNGHHHADLPPLKSFMSARRRLLKTQKRAKLEALSPRNLKGALEAEKEDSDVEHELNVFDAKPACDEIGIDIFIEIYANEKDAKPTGEEQMGKIDFLKEIEDQEDNKSIIEDNGIATSEEGVMQVISPKVIEDSKVESSSEISHDVSVTWLDDILGGYYENFQVDETQKQVNSEESTYFEEQRNRISYVLEDASGSTETQEIEYSSTEMGCDQSSFTEEIFKYLTNAQDYGGENKELVDDEASCNMKALDEEKETIDNSQCQKMSETCKIDEASEDGNSSSLENIDESNKGERQIELVEEKDQVKAKRFQSTSDKGGEEESTSKNWRGAIRRKRGVEDDDEMRKFNPKEPNFLPLAPEPEQEKVDLRHQMVDERKNAEDWMLDCALRQAVTKLAPARKKKVALLVEAFETVMPAAPKCETNARKNSAFGHAGRIQACS
uniref:Calmodulin-binding domain-containing protein n=1 Tax=Cajanus cajan TaxID=3821 RepID=A0A151RL20_CAJCA|nr:hypothetical protein KK1_035295 [Cajanus cajan]